MFPTKKRKGICLPCLFYVNAVQIDKYYKQKVGKKEECLIWTAIRTKKN